MILVTTDSVSGKVLETIGLVKGCTAHEKNIGLGGAAKAYTEMMDEARTIATKRMVQEAEQAGADAIVGVRFSSTEVMQAAFGVVVYGTAVKFK